eukprot:8818251-Pyramimonas_sp.AAC.1
MDLDVVSCNAGISACEKGGQWQRALRLLRGMRELRLEPSVIYSAMPGAARGRCPSGQSLKSGMSLYRGNSRQELNS